MAAFPNNAVGRSRPRPSCASRSASNPSGPRVGPPRRLARLQARSPSRARPKVICIGEEDVATGIATDDSVAERWSLGFVGQRQLLESFSSFDRAYRSFSFSTRAVLSCSSPVDLKRCLLDNHTNKSPSSTEDYPQRHTDSSAQSCDSSTVSRKC